MIYIVNNNIILAPFCHVIREIIFKRFKCQMLTIDPGIELIENNIVDGDIFFINGQFSKIFSSSIKKRNIHIFIINNESLIGQDTYRYDNIQMIAQASCNSTYILDYQANNIKYVNNNSSNIKALYLPYTINPHMNHLYKKYIHTQFVEKDIDVLFYGMINVRRRQILDQLATKYKVIYKTYDSIDEQIKDMQRSKIILNLYYYENNKPFDYYRLSFLLANQLFFITETPSDVNFTIEPQLTDYQKYIISADYEQIINTTTTYLDKKQDERDNLAVQASNWFSKQFVLDQSISALIENISSVEKIENITPPKTTPPSTPPKITLPSTPPKITLPPTFPKTTLPPTPPKTTLPPIPPKTTLPPTPPKTTLPPTPPKTTLAPTLPKTTLPPTPPKITLPSTLPKITLPPTPPKSTLLPTLPKTTLPPPPPKITLPSTLPKTILPPTPPKITLPSTLPPAPPKTILPSTPPKTILPSTPPKTILPSTPPKTILPSTPPKTILPCISKVSFPPKTALPTTSKVNIPSKTILFAPPKTILLATPKVKVAPKVNVVPTLL